MLLLSALTIGLVQTFHYDSANSTITDDTKDSYDNNSMCDMTLVNCSEWKQTNHIYFQLANTFFFLSYLAPNGMYGMLYLRCTVLVGCAFYTLWGWTVQCFFDAVVWNVMFVAINFIHVCILLFYLRPVKFPREVEEVRFSFILNYMQTIYLIYPSQLLFSIILCITTHLILKDSKINNMTIIE